MFSNQYYNQKLLVYWIITLIILIFIMIIVGGLTRLTNSGLSITEWELFKGILPPLNQDDWDNYFNLYKTIPQFKLVNFSMTIDEFKIIFYWEYFHRLLGRLIGVCYLIPLLYFTFSQTIKKVSLKILYFVFFLILLQGIMGWYMVESGLINLVSVSHYRLSVHLILAFIIISILFWMYLNLKIDNYKNFFNSDNLLIKFLLILVYLQIIMGAFVSGLDAGMIYQTWPKMNFSFFPSDINIVDLNIPAIFNTQSLVQFIHRSLAYIISFYVLFLGIRFYVFDKKPYLKSYIILLTSLLFQIFLGIITLVSGLNMYLASMHQIMSIILVFAVINYNHKFS